MFFPSVFKEIMFRKFWYYLWHYDINHSRSDLGEIFKYESLPQGGQVGFRRCLKCDRVFVDFDEFSWSNTPVKQ